MCILYPKKIISQRSCKAYKVVVPAPYTGIKGRFQSPVACSSRMLQAGCRNVGTVLSYIVGESKRVSYPGTYLFTELSDAKDCAQSYARGAAVLEVTIPGGARGLRTPDWDRSGKKRTAETIIINRVVWRKR